MDSVLNTTSFVTPNSITHFNNVLLITKFIEVEASIPGTFCLVNYHTPKPSIGAFEITYKGKIIYSKKTTGLFPSVEPTV